MYGPHDHDKRFGGQAQDHFSSLQLSYEASQSPTCINLVENMSSPTNISIYISH